MESQTLQNALSTPERVATSRGHAALVALLLATLLVVTVSTHELSDRLAAGAASTSEAIVQVQARQADELDELAALSTRIDEATRARIDADARIAAYGAELARLTAGPVANDSPAAWARGAVVGVAGGTGFAASYRDGATYVVTALHVLGGMRSAAIITRQGSYVGRLVAVSSADAALLKIDTLTPILFFRGVVSPGDPVSLVRYADGLSESATVSRVSDNVIELALPARPIGFWLGFSGSPVVAANGYAVGIMSSVSGDGSVAQVVPRSATCDILLCK